MSFTAESLRKKLQDLDASQQSIQTVSTWCLIHKKHAKDIVKIWHEMLRISVGPKKLALMYLCNDIIQTSKKKTEAFADEFQGILIPVLEHVFRQLDDDKLTTSVRRIIKVWSDRQVYPKDFIIQLNNIADNRGAPVGGGPSGDSSQSARNAASSSDVTDGTVAVNNASSTSTSATSSSKRLKTTSKASANGNLTSSESAARSHSSNSNIPLPTVETPMDAYVEEEEAAVPDDIDYEKISPDEILRDIMRLYASLEHAATTDLQLRHRLTSFPKHLSDPVEAEKFFAAHAAKSKGASSSTASSAAAELVEAEFKQLNEHMRSLKEFNNRLEAELADRKQLVIKFKILSELHRRALHQADAKLGETKTRMKKVKEVFEIVKAHVKNLPDLSQLTDE